MRRRSWLSGWLCKSTGLRQSERCHAIPYNSHSPPMTRRPAESCRSSSSRHPEVWQHFAHDIDRSEIWRSGPTRGETAAIALSCKVRAAVRVPHRRDDLHGTRLRADSSRRILARRQQRQQEHELTCPCRNRLTKRLRTYDTRETPIRSYSTSSYPSARLRSAMEAGISGPRSR